MGVNPCPLIEGHPSEGSIIILCIIIAHSSESVIHSKVFSLALLKQQYIIALY